MGFRVDLIDGQRFLFDGYGSGADSSPMLYGYARATVGSETIKEQADALNAAGCAHIFTETDNHKRPQLAQAIQAAAFGDVLMVTRLDRLARSAADLFAIYKKLSERGAGAQSLTEAITDPATIEGRHFPRFVAWLADFDAATFQERMREGRKNAKAAGVKMGPPSKLSAHQIEHARRLYEDEGRNLDEIAKLLRVSTPTISRVLAPFGSTSASTRKKGPPMKLTPRQIEQVLKMRKDEGRTMAQIAAVLKVSQPTISRALSHARNADN